jgi:hypothetical protein
MLMSADPVSITIFNSFYLNAMLSIAYMGLVASEPYIPHSFGDRIKGSGMFQYTVKAYNGVQIGFNAYIVWLIFQGYAGTPSDGTVVGEIERWVGLSQTGFTWQLRPVQLYYIAKYLDWVDTLIIVMKKSRRQLSWLHCAHHMIMPWICHLVFAHFPQAMILYTYQTAMNSWVHVMMYGYYLMNPMYPAIARYKLLLTEFQLFQFWSCVVVALWSTMKPDFSWFGFGGYMAMSTLMIQMFGTFYRKEKKKPGQVTIC